MSPKWNSDTATVIQTDATYVPNYWIKISSDSYLVAKGRKYVLKGSEGITPDSLLWLPQSGKASFKLIFEPLPKNTKSFDFIESNGKDLFGIDLTGKTEFDGLESIPAELKEFDMEASVPVPELKIGETTITAHFPGCRPDILNGIEVCIVDIFGRQESYKMNVDEKTGIATYKFQQYGPAYIFIDKNAIGLAETRVAAGENIDMYIDMGYIGNLLMKQRKNDVKNHGVKNMCFSYSSGIYSNLNYADSRIFDEPYFEMNQQYSGFADCGMNADEYTRHVATKYLSLCDSIENCTMSKLRKELNMISLKQNTVSAIVNGDMIREQEYRVRNDDWRNTELLPYRNDNIQPRHIATIMELFET